MYNLHRVFLYIYLMIDFTKKIYNSDKFRKPAIQFKTTGKYCQYPKGTTEYIKFWEQEMDYCINGYTAEDGDFITGYNYFYLNYCPIQRIIYEKELDKKGNEVIKRKREQEFPDFWDYDYYYFQAIEEAEEVGKHLVVAKSRRKGYEQPYSELVATPTGFKTMGSLQIGDEVMTPYGTSTKIKEVYEQGYKDLYEVVLHDGRKVRCGKHHLWRVYKRGSRKKDDYRVMTTWDLIQDGLYNIRGKYRIYKYYLEPIEEVPYKEKNLLIHPYILGCLLGDGTINKKGKSVKISTSDQEIIDEFQRILGEDYELKRDPTCYNYRIIYKRRFDKDITKQFENGKFGVNPLARYITELGLNCSCDQKFIPTEYIYSSIEQRYELVKGLMDTDGTISPDGSMMFANTSKQLIDGLALVLRSLGIRCEIGTYKKDGCRLLYRLYIRSRKNLFKLTRKVSRINTDKRLWSKVAIVEINPLDYQEQCKCILLEDDRHMYLTRDYIPTHNSYKGASMLCRNFFLIPNSKSYVYVSNKQYLTEDGILTKAWAYMDFIDEHTAWAKKRQVANTQLRRRASMIVTDEYGNKVEVGYKSEIIGVSLKDNPDAVRGKAGKLILWEEAGSFPQLDAAWQIARPSVEQDGVAFGLMLAFGTGGDQGPAVASLREAFYNPESFNCLSFENIWEDSVQAKPCGFFVPQHTNLDIRDEKGNRLYMDKDGNTLHNKAKELILKQREEELKSAKSSEQVDRYIAEHAETPSESFTEFSGNIFPKKELQKQLAKIRTNKKLANAKQVGDLIIVDGQPVWNIKKTGDITEYPLPKTADPTGAVVIWEHPIKDAPFGLYIIGVDPYDHDQSGSSSLGSCLVYKRHQDFESYSDMIVAEYTGRPATAEIFYEKVYRLALYYNARIMYENQNKGLFMYFKNKHIDYLLADQPDILKDIVSNSNVNRGKGSHMTKEIKIWAFGKIKEWLEEDRGNGQLGLNTIFSEPLLEELIKCNDKSNVDRCLVKDTQITTLTGFKNVQDIRVGDFVLTIDGTYQKVSWLDNHTHNGKIIGLKILGDYRILECTDNHPIYIASTSSVTHSNRIKSLNYKHFEEAGKLNYKYQFTLVPKRKDLPKCELPADILYLIGWFLSDGWASTNNDKMSITLQFDQEKIADKLIGIINDFCDGETFIKGNNLKLKFSVRKIFKDNCWRIYINSPKLHKLVTDWGCISHNKLIPYVKYNQSGLMPLVIGFLEGDGHQKLNVHYDKSYRNDIECSGIYWELIHQIRQILIDNGIWTTIEKSCKNTQRRIHIQAEYINKMLQFYPSIKFSTVNHKVFKHLALEDEDGFWCPIKKIYERDSEEKVYNFEVENNHTYVANGIVTHNCMALCQIMIYREQLYNVQIKEVKETEKKQRLFNKPLFSRDDNSEPEVFYDHNITTFMFTN